MKKLIIFASMSMLFISVGPALADDDPTPSVGSKITTSKAYVDGQLDLKQNNISAGTYGNGGSVVTYTASQGSVGEKPILYKAASGTASYNSAALVEAGQVNTAIQNGLNSHLTCANAGTCTLWQINTVSGTQFSN